MSKLFQVRSFTADDYGTVESWWHGHGWDGVPMAVLPRLGVIAECDGKPIAAAWLYMDNSVGVCMMEWVVADPEANPREVVKGIKVLAEYLRLAAIDMNYSVMLTTCKQDSLAKLYERSGFHRTDSEMHHLLRVL